MYRITDIGCFSFPATGKYQNEDAFLPPTYDCDGNIVIAISDGVGSTRDAELASFNAIKAISDSLSNDKFSIDSAFINAKKEVDKISELGKSNAATTLTVVHVKSNEIIIGHVGDCRAYYRKSDKFVQITTDHTRYQELLDLGEHGLRKLQKHKIRLSSILVKALAHNFELDYDVISIPIDEVSDGDDINIMLMSDGAYHHWDLRRKFSQSTLYSPSSFSASLRKRVRKNVIDDSTFLNISLVRDSSKD